MTDFYLGGDAKWAIHENRKGRKRYPLDGEPLEEDKLTLYALMGDILAF